MQTSVYVRYNYLIPCCGVFLLPERLLLSLLPAHIARVMKDEIIQRLQGPMFGQVENTNNFHNLYVQRHTNVRCVDIINKKITISTTGLTFRFELF